MHSYIQADLKEKMVFLGGPRQVGKTTVSLNLLAAKDESHPAYFNWDIDTDRMKLLKGELPRNEPLVVLDEIHKYLRWRNLVKGLYDKNKSKVSFLVTGSARLDYYARGGDSLHGRYHYFRLHPFSVNEISASDFSRTDLERLLRFGGFPEPFTKANDTHWRRWQRERRQKILNEDLRDLERVREIALIELLPENLPARVGSPLSVQNVREELGVAHETTEKWLQILENLYFCFRISPFGSPKIRAVKKERKLYFWDWSVVPDEGAKFENLVASQLLKYCHFIEDTEGHDMELRFLRDTDKREIDFVVLKDRRPLFAVECKSGEKKVSPHIAYFKERTKIPVFYQVHKGTSDFLDAKTGTRVMPFIKFCQEMKFV